MVNTAWDRVQVSTIVYCYRHVKILPSPSTDDSDEDDDIPLSLLQSLRDEDDTPLIELQMKMRELGTSSVTAEEYVGVDEEEETGRHLNDDDIMKLVSREEIPEVADEEDDEEPSKDVTVFEALESIRILINFLSSQHQPSWRKRGPTSTTFGR
uniref:Uncharacterized protein LOC111138416 n=1 Tax=Crassostrea virginica TaxID=6565 RepID=A0A8B8F2M8_CRAVI|nr:uncharacterized protein LOC111138416 [Crassostrea virginica]